MNKEKAIADSLGRIKEQQDSIKRAAVIQNVPSDSLEDGKKLKVNVLNSTKALANDSLFLKKGMLRRNTEEKEEDNETVDSSAISISKVTIEPKKTRTALLTNEEKARIDSVIYDQGYITNAMTMAINNSRNLKNSFDIKNAQIDTDQREYRRYQIAWYQKYTQAFACFMMFLIGAPLGAIIKKGGLGMPVLISIIFFILYYMLTISGEKWAKEGLVDPLFGTWFSNLCLLPFGLFFLKQARNDSSLFEPDFYQRIWKSLQKRLKVLRSKTI
jgi:lipopolysaccharide export system permease protein